jgi:hypothetical protein
MFSLSPLKYPPSTELVVPWQVLTTFIVSDFIRFPAGTTSYSLWVDLGDGNETSLIAETDPDAEFTHTYTDMSVVTLRMLVQYGSSDVREKFAWPIQLSADAADFAIRAIESLSVMPMAHATFDLPQGRRHILVPMIRATQEDPVSPPTQPSADAFRQGIELLLRQFQQAWANGFGRIPAPAEPLQRGVHVHMLGDSLIYGTSTVFQAALTKFEQAIQAAWRDPRKGEALAAIKESLDGVVDSVTDLGDLNRVNLTGGNFLVPGKRTIRYWDVLDWRAFINSGIDENQSLGDVAIEDWRKFLGKLDREKPVVDWTTAWEWSLTQSVIQAIGAMYMLWGATALPTSIRLYVSAVPGVGAVSLRMYDDTLKFWLQATLAPTDSDGHLTLSEMIDDGATVSQPAGTHVAGRVAGVIDLSDANLLHLFDVAHVEAALQGVTFAEVPSIQSLTAGVISVFREVVGAESSKVLAPDGSSYVASTVTGAVSVATIGVPALVLPVPGSDNWSSLDALANLALVRK